MRASIKTRIITTCAIGFGTMSLATAPAQAAQQCGGLTPTITSSARVVNGTARADVILVLGSGKHTVNAGDGNDTICGSVGADTINAGSGNDVVTSGSGDDVINAGDGNDTVDSGLGNDSIIGGIGNDTITAGTGNDAVTAGTGNDTIDGGAGTDTVSGGPGDDKVNGGAGDDALSGSSGIDRITGGAGTDVILGGDGNDELNGQAGSDTLKGEAGDDLLQGGADRDVLTPGSGANICASDPNDAILGACEIDYLKPTKPVVTLPSSISAGETLTVTWTTTDMSGISLSIVGIGGASGWVTEWCGFLTEGSLISTSGTERKFLWQCTVPSTAVNGNYSLWIWAVDTFGNRSDDAVAEFSVGNGVADSAPPTISDVQVSGVARYGQPVTMTWRVTDESGVFGATDVTGISGVTPWFMSDQSGAGFAGARGVYVDYGSYDVKLIEGNEKDGKYQATIGFYSYAPVGDYTIWMSARDIYGNRNFTSTEVKVSLAE